MEEASNPRDPLPSMANPVEKPQTTSPARVQFPTLNPIWRLSPWHNGSTLFDSYEFHAVTQQLNKAIQGSNHSSPPYMRHLKSPFYRQRLDLIYKGSAKTQKRISCTESACPTRDKKAARSGKGFVAQLWKKIKHSLTRNK